jgi:hypothetical protein
MRFDSGSDSWSAIVRASSARSRQCFWIIEDGWTGAQAERERWGRRRRFASWSVAMPTPEECLHNAEICLTLANGANEIYVKTALIELAEELRSMAEHLERRAQREG